MKIEEILGYNSATSKDSESITKRYYVKCLENEGPDAAKTAFQAFAESLPVPNGLELGDVTLDEEKNVNGLYFGTISFRNASPQIKTEIAGDLFETFGEKMSESRKSGSHERFFRIKSDSARNARQRLESYIRSTMETSGRLHLSDISVDESQSGDGFFNGHVTYNNPDTFASRDKLNGIVPAYGSRAAGDKRSRNVERAFELRGYNTVQQAWDALYYNFGNDPDIESIEVEEDSGGGESLFTGRIRFSREQPEEESNRSVSFEVAGSQTKMTCSHGTRGGWAANGSPRNYGGLIGVTNDGVEGVDIDTAVSTFCETVSFYPWFLTSSYVAFLARAYGCINSSPFRGFAAGEVRFLGASGSYKQNDKIAELTFKFAVSPNAMNIRVGNMTIPFKYGWDYLWVRWAEMKRNGICVKVPIEAYVEKVYQDMNFYALGIG
jgi:hypothetical protein